MTRDDVAAEVTVGVWPDNWDAVNLFVSLMTQWRVAMGARTGLDYGVLPTVMRLRGFARACWPALFDDIREMEHEALKTMSENQ